jgi:hypothetical protein
MHSSFADPILARAGGPMEAFEKTAAGLFFLA